MATFTEEMALSFRIDENVTRTSPGTTTISTYTVPDRAYAFIRPIFSRMIKSNDGGSSTASTRGRINIKNFGLDGVNSTVFNRDFSAGFLAVTTSSRERPDDTNLFNAVDMAYGGEEIKVEFSHLDSSGVSINLRVIFEIYVFNRA